MIARILPDEPNYRFAPSCDVQTGVQQIQIVIKRLSHHVPIALNLDDAPVIPGQAQAPPRPRPQASAKVGTGQRTDGGAARIPASGRP